MAEQTQQQQQQTTQRAQTKTNFNVPQGATKRIVDADAIKKLTGLDITSFASNLAQQNRQKNFDPDKFVNDVKTPSCGKPLNNNDRYPIDNKIMELETHSPRVKQYFLSYKSPLDVAKAVLSISDYTEKRLVKLENILATVMRYVFATGSRFAVNCVYYGGQDHRAFYSINY